VALRPENPGSTFLKLRLPLRDLIGMNVEVLGQISDGAFAPEATFALKAGVWFRRGRLVIVSPDSLGTACQLSGRNSTYRPVQFSRAGSVLLAITWQTIYRIKDDPADSQAALIAWGL
jgi:hypothetical protein